VQFVAKCDILVRQEDAMITVVRLPVEVIEDARKNGKLLNFSLTNPINIIELFRN
jgi:hypothetical protein